MYLRTIRRRNRNGSVVAYHQLAENTWDPEKGCAVARVIYSFGRADELDRGALQRLARSILRVFSGEEALAAEPGVEVLDAWPFGGIHVLESLWRELEIPKVVEAEMRRQKSRQPLERALFAMVANRALRPYSKLHTHEQWMEEEVFLPGQEQVGLQHLYRAMDFLEDHKEQIERASTSEWPTCSTSTST
jgi:hypothetical protein